MTETGSNTPGRWKSVLQPCRCGAIPRGNRRAPRRPRGRGAEKWPRRNEGWGGASGYGRRVLAAVHGACELPAPGPAKTALFRYAGLGATTGGQTLARFVARGWLREAADPADGRRRRVGATAAGQAAFRAGALAFNRAAPAALRPLHDGELTRLARPLGTMMRHYDVRPRPGARPADN